MVYIILLNWQGASDTLACLASLAQLRGVPYRVVICDNASPDGSYEVIRSGLADSNHYGDRPLVELSREQAAVYRLSPAEHDALFLIQTGANLGYAGGNNIGIRFAMNQPDMQYVWLLNNDTEVHPDALRHMVARCEQDPTIGICGSRLVYYYDREHLQGLGGVYNPWLGTTRHYAAMAPSDAVFDDDKVSAEIDYVIGASMLLTRSVLEKVGLLCEDYFLYFEELEYSTRSKRLKHATVVASDSIVYHKEGASTSGTKSTIADYYSFRSRLLFSKREYKPYFPVVCFSLIFVAIRRLLRHEPQKIVYIFKAFGEVIVR